MIRLRTANSNTKYCDECAREIKKIQDKEADRKYKEKLKMARKRKTPSKP